MSYFEQSGSRPRAQGYLTEEQINHFLERLLAWRAELVASTNGIMAEFKEVELR